MSAFSFIFLNLGCLVLFLVITSFFKQHTRIIFWTVGLLLFVLTCFLLGFGVFKTWINDRSNGAGVLIPVILLCESAVLIYMAEKWNNTMKSRNKVETSGPSEVSILSQSVEEQVLSLPYNLDSPMARKIFPKVISSGMIVVQGSHFVWKESKVLLAYLCGRIYCGDEPELLKQDKKAYWKIGNRRVFPDDEICQLFNITGIGQARMNRRDSIAPTNHEKIDQFFEKS